MNRNNVSRHIRRFLPCLLLAALAQVTGARAAQPNIVYIVADDLDLALFQQDGGLKSLLTDQGTTFDAHYVSVSLCCPSRTTALRGQFAHNTGVLTNNAPDGGMAKVVANNLEQSTVATWLQGAGYRTALIGKYLNGYPQYTPSKTYIPPGWSHFIVPNGGLPYNQAGYNLNLDGTTRWYGYADWAYLGDVIANQAVKFIYDSATGEPGRPFFLYVAPYSPHWPATPAPRHRALVEGRAAPRSPAWNEPDVTDKPVWVRNRWPLSSSQIASTDALYGRRLASLVGIRETVARIIDILRYTGHLDDTYLFFTSDNGYHMGQHRLAAGKLTPYEEDIHVPLVVRGPGVPAGRHIGELTLNTDFAPTFAELAGAGVPNFVDGRSLVRLLEGGAVDQWRRAVLLESGNPVTLAAPQLAGTDHTLEPPDPFDLQASDRPFNETSAPRFSGLRTAGLTYVEYDGGERELYDDRSDPAQLDNAYGRTDPALIGRLHDWLAQLRVTGGDTLRGVELGTAFGFGAPAARATPGAQAAALTGRAAPSMVETSRAAR